MLTMREVIRDSIHAITSAVHAVNETSALTGVHAFLPDEVRFDLVVRGGTRVQVVVQLVPTDEEGLYPQP